MNFKVSELVLTLGIGELNHANFTLFLTEYCFRIYSYSDVELAHTFTSKGELFAVS